MGSIESAIAIANKSPIKLLSEQEIIDCSESFGNLGCRGGLIDFVFKYAISEGIAKLNDYKLTKKVFTFFIQSEKCHLKMGLQKTKISSYKSIEIGDEDDLIRVLSTTGPVSISIDASSDEFHYYESGIFELSECSQTMLDHAVIAVGYDLTGKIPFLIVKNRLFYNFIQLGYNMG